VDGAELGLLARSDGTDVGDAVAAARDAATEWAGRTVVERGLIIRRAAQRLEAEAADLIRIVRQETGKPEKDAQGELNGAVEMGHFIAGEGRRFYGRTTTSAVPGKSVTVHRAPLGVAALIVAANTPVPNYAWKVFPALLCGNSVVLKPSENTPFSAVRFVELLHEAGVPGSVLNLVQGVGTEAGTALVDADVDVVSFTGSAAVGRSIATRTAARLVKTCLELGGKNPLVVCDDADIDRAVEAAWQSAFTNAGQRCAAGSRIIVMDAVYDEFRRRLLERVKQLRVSAVDGDLGPVINKQQMEAMLSAVAAATDRGATLLTGGDQLTGPGYDGGCFVAPTLLENALADDEISHQELFGPITCLYRVPDFAAAVRLADDTSYGLTAAIWTSNINRAHAFTNAIQAGMVVVNGPTYGSEPHMPFGGFRQSGNGFREAGTEVLDVYSDWKTVAVLHDPAAV
jgi:aldehyde dehydrogenase (NAD+)